MEKFESNYEIDPNCNQHIIDERGNTYLMMARYKWFGQKDFKLGLRTFYSTSDGERVGKGMSFLTEDGPHELTKVLLEDGYGHPDEIADTLKEKRPEIVGAIMKKIEEMDDDEKTNCMEAYNNCDDYSDNDDMFDPEDLLEDDEAI